MPSNTGFVVPYLTLRDKNIDLNNFKTDILANYLEESRLGFEDTRDGRGGGLIKPKEFSHEKWTQW